MVGKDDLLRVVWSDLVVTENSLAQCVKEIRRELGDSDEALVRTVHRRGYVLEAAVTKVGGVATAARQGMRERRLSLIVLPLANLDGDAAHDYFAEGLTEDLTTDLGRIPGAFVISRGTAQTYGGRKVDARQVGRDLGVKYAVEGSVRRSGTRVVVSLSVSDTSDATELWAERFEAARPDLERLQRSMAGKVAQMLHLELANAEARRIQHETNPDAHDLATRAWSIWYRLAPEMSDEVWTMVRRALELDPGCVLGWVMLANLHVMALSTRRTTDPAASMREGEDAARRALALDPEHRTANSSLGAMLAYQGRFEEALAAIARQMALNPNLAIAHQWKGIVHLLMGDARLAIEPFETAIDLSPWDSRISTFIRNLALAHLHLGRDAEGLAIAERSVHVPKPWPRSYETLAAACAVNGLVEEARAAVEVLVRHWPGYSIARHRAEMMSDRPAFLAQRERLLEGLRVAGLPER